MGMQTPDEIRAEPAEIQNSRPDLGDLNAGAMNPRKHLNGYQKHIKVGDLVTRIMESGPYEGQLTRGRVIEIRPNGTVVMQYIGEHAGQIGYTSIRTLERHQGKSIGHNRIKALLKNRIRKEFIQQPKHTNGYHTKSLPSIEIETKSLYDQVREVCLNGSH